MMKFSITTLIFFVAVTCSSGSLDRFIGTWYPVLINGRVSVAECQKFVISQGMDPCVSNSSMVYIKYAKSEEDSMQFPFVALSGTDAASPEHPMSCNTTDIEDMIPPMIFRSDGEYLVIYVMVEDIMELIWFAKEIPTPKKLDEFVAELGDSENRTRICTTENPEVTSDKKVIHADMLKGLRKH